MHIRSEKVSSGGYREVRGTSPLAAVACLLAAVIVISARFVTGVVFALPIAVILFLVGIRPFWPRLAELGRMEPAEFWKEVGSIFGRTKPQGPRP